MQENDVKEDTRARVHRISNQADLCEAILRDNAGTIGQWLDMTPQELAVLANDYDGPGFSPLNEVIDKLREAKMASQVTEALHQHAKFAKGLVKVTWWLVGVTLALTVATAFVAVGTFLLAGHNG
jgi:hypothetical protein